MATIVSVNVGMPREIEWRGRIVRTAIWKTPVSGRVFAGRLNLAGDGQGDLAGHGGEQRAVMIYQIGSYRHWQEYLSREKMEPGSFGENFTVDGLPDDEVCIGDRYRIGTALFEVTQPRVTCYRVGIRMNHPQMAALLTASGRPGFYFRVLEEGEVGAGDPITLISKDPQCMTVTKVNALLYSPHHPRDQLERALQIPALSAGWRWSFEALVRSQDAQPGASGNAGLGSGAATQGVAPGFHALRVARVVAESADVISLELQPIEAKHLTVPQAGQFVVLRLHPKLDGPPLLRSYSLSGPPSGEQYRVSIKIEPNGAAGTYVRNNIRVGDTIDVSEPRGGFTLRPDDRAVVLLSAGIGATPVMAMLHALAAGSTSREVWWLHNARNGASHSFSVEARQLLGTLVRGRSRIWYSRPAAGDVAGRDYDAIGRMDQKAFEQLNVPRGADFYICGPSNFIADMSEGLAASGVPKSHIHSEFFGGSPSLTPGVIDAPRRPPHQPAGAPGTGPLVSFARSGLSTRWREGDQSLLELAEACDVPVRWSCRAGVCHNCESGLISGTVTYQPDPLDRPARGNLLLCCSQPQDDVVIDI